MDALRSAAARLRVHLGIARQFARAGIVRKSQFRTEFFSQVVMDCIWYSIHILVFEFLFQHTESIAGWTLPEVRVFLGYLFVADAFMMTWLGQGWRFGRDLKDGLLDPIRVRPASPIFLYFFQQFSLEGAVNLSIAFGYLGYGLLQSGLELAPGTAVLALWGVAIAWWGRALLTILFSISEFYLLHSDLAQFLSELFIQPADRPLDIFGRRLKQFLLFLIPVGALSYLPACLVLGRIGPAAGLFHSAWLFGLGLLVFRFWRHSFRRYESAMS